jgi:hypothetical protein
MKPKQFIFTLFFTLYITVSATAQTSTVAYETPVNFKVDFLGKENQMFLVNVLYKNETGSAFSLSITDDEGQIVFRNIYNTSTLDKKFRIPEHHGKLNFIFTTLSDKSVKSFQVSPRSRFNQEVVIRDR